MKNIKFCCLAGTLALAPIGCNQKAQTGPPPERPRTSGTRALNKKAYGVHELHSFRDRELFPIVRQLIGKKSPYPKINERIEDSCKKIFTRIGADKLLLCVFSDGYYPLDPDVIASGGIDTNQNATVRFYLPAVKTIFDRAAKLEQKQNWNWRDAFTSCITIAYMHELEHLRENNPIYAIDLAEEKRAWAETCRYSIVPLVDSYNVSLLGSDGKFYEAWKRSEENPKSGAWEEFVAKRYGSLVGKHL